MDITEAEDVKKRWPWIFPSCGRCSLVTTGPQRPALVASGKASPRLHILLVLLYVLFQSIRMDFPNQLY